MAMTTRVGRRQQQQRRSGLGTIRFSSKRLFRTILISLAFLALVPPLFFIFKLKTFRLTQLRKCGWLNSPPLVCAHGGDSSSAFPNTMAAYHSALNSQVDCIEIDVSRSSDGVLLALHDRDLQRISGNNTSKVGHSSMEEIKHRGSNYQSAKFQNANIPTIEEALKVGFIVIIDQSTGVRTNLLRMRDARFVCLGIICGAYSSKKSNQSFFALMITLVQFIYLFTISRGVHVVESISLLCKVGVFALYISINGSTPIKAITRMISSNSSAAATYCPGRRQRLFVIAVDCYDQNGNGTQTFQEIILSVKKATSLGFGQGRVGFVLLTGSSLQETLKAFKGCQVSIEEFDASAKVGVKCITLGEIWQLMQILKRTSSTDGLERM